MKLRELKDKTDKELLKCLSDSKKELMHLRFQKTNGEAVSNARVRLLRVSIARVKTLLTLLRRKLNDGKINA